MTSIKVQFRSLNAYDLHKRLINDYVLSKPGASRLLKRDTTRDKRDIDVIRENHRFLWEDDNAPNTWEEQLARKYYDKLFKEYCISDLSRYKENMIAMRWRTEPEVITGKGQFSCGNKRCDEKEGLRTWEVNFGYIEQGEKKNALVKLRLCPECSIKLNYRSRKREIKRLKGHKRKKHSSKEEEGIKEVEETNVNDSTITREEINEPSSSTTLPDDENIWTRPREEEIEKSRGDEFAEFLEELLL